ncbi:MAG: hypothetical protein Q8920_04495 [Bacillota bacterium]|nr:hypothetical protein [Bacillota bacterium]
MTVGELLVKISGDASGLNKEVKDSTNTLEAFNSKVNSITGLLKGAFAIYGGKKLFDFTVGSNAEFEQYTTSFEVLLGSADRAKEHMQYLFDFAAKTPFQLPEIVEASKLLETFGLDTKKYLTQAGNAASAFNVPISQVADAIGRLAAGQTGEALEQLRRLGVSMKQLKDQGIEFDKGGQLVSSISKTLDAVMSTFDTKYKGMMDKQSQTFNGQMSTILDNISAFGRQIGSKVFDLLKDKQSEFMATWDRWSKDGTLDKIASGLSDALIFVVNLLTSAVEIMAKYGKEIVGVVSGIVALSAALRVAATAQAAFNIAASANPIIAIAAGITGLIGGIIGYTAISKAAQQQSAATDKAMQEEVDETNKLLNQYDQLALKANKTTEEKTQLHDIEKRLAELYPSTVDGIDKQNEKYTTQIDLVKKLNNEKQKQVDIDTEVAASKASGEIPELQKQIKDYEKERQEIEKVRDEVKAYVDKNEALYTTISEMVATGKVGSNPEFLSLSKQIFDMGFPTVEGFISHVQGKIEQWEDLNGDLKTLDEKVATTKSKISEYGEAILNMALSKYKDLDTDGYIKQMKQWIIDMQNGVLTLQQLQDKIDGLNKKAYISSAVPSQYYDYIANAMSGSNQETETDDKNYDQPDDTPRTSTSQSYSNEPLQNALKQLEHKKNMDQLSLQEELDYLNKIKNLYVKNADERMDLEERIYSVEKAIKDKKLQDSVNWIAEQKALGKLSADDEIAAWTRVYDNQKDNIEAVKEATQNLYRLKKELSDKEVTDTKNNLDKMISDYIDKKSKQYDWEEEQEDKRLNDKLDAIEKEYQEIDDQEAASNRADERADAEDIISRYAGAATPEGQKILKDAQDKIKQLNQEDAKAAREKEKEDRIAAVQQEIEDNKNKYKQLRADLEVEQQQMEDAAQKFAEESVSTLSDADSRLKEAMTNATKSFNDSQTNFMNEGLKKLRTFVDNYKKIAAELSMPDSSNNPSTPGSSGGNSNITINDYGDKNLYGIDDVDDYGNQLFSTAKDASRSSGGNLG